MLNLLQSLYLLFFIEVDEIFNDNNFIRKRLSNSYSNKIIKLKLVDFLKIISRRFVFDSYIFMRSDLGISDLGKNEFLETSFYLN